MAKLKSDDAVPEHSMKPLAFVIAALAAAVTIVKDAVKTANLAAVGLLPDARQLRATYTVTPMPADGTTPKDEARRAWRTRYMLGAYESGKDANERGRKDEASDGRTTVIYYAPPAALPESTLEAILAGIDTILDIWQPPEVVQTATGAKAGESRFRRSDHARKVRKALRSESGKEWSDVVLLQAQALADQIGPVPVSISSANLHAKPPKRTAYKCDVSEHAEVSIAANGAPPYCGACFNGQLLALQAAPDGPNKAILMEAFATLAKAAGMKPKADKAETKPAQEVSAPPAEPETVGEPLPVDEPETVNQLTA